MVDRLKEEVDSLKGENDSLKDENTRLKEEIENLKKIVNKSCFISVEKRRSLICGLTKQ